jgi:type IV secretory pathway VirB4 component
MADLTNIEKRKFEQLLDMSSGYVLDFSNRTFAEFITDSVNRDICDARYDNASGSKANRLRAFWTEEGNQVVGRLMGEMIDYAVDRGLTKNDNPALLEACRKIVTRLQQEGPVSELETLTRLSIEEDFEVVVKAVRDAINRNEPETALDRLHTFVIKYVRTLCQRRGVEVAREKPLHSLFGEYVKRLRDGDHIESEMTARILKSSISVLEAFNDVRNSQSLAHDNPLLNYEEALLIYNHVASSVRFLRNLEGRIARVEQQQLKPADPMVDDDIPF